MIRAGIRAVVLAAVLLGSAAAPAQEQKSARPLGPPDEVQRKEALLARAYPGATVDWEAVALVYPDGRRVPFTFGFYRERPRMGEIFVIATYPPDRSQAEAIERLRKDGTPPADLARCRLSLMRTDASGTVLGYKETGVDIPDVGSSCDFVNFDYAYESAGLPPPFVTGQPAPSWPLVLINFTTLHVRSDVWASILWAGVLETDTLAWVSRLPVELSGQRRGGPRVGFLIRNDRGMGGGGWLFTALASRDQPMWEVRAPCGPSRCKVEPKDVLDAALQSEAWK